MLNGKPRLTEPQSDRIERKLDELLVLSEWIVARLVAMDDSDEPKVAVEKPSPH